MGIFVMSYDMIHFLFKTGLAFFIFAIILAGINYYLKSNYYTLTWTRRPKRRRFKLW